MSAANQVARAASMAMNGFSQSTSELSKTSTQVAARSNPNPTNSGTIDALPGIKNAPEAKQTQAPATADVPQQKAPEQPAPANNMPSPAMEQAPAKQPSQAQSKGEGLVSKALSAIAKAPGEVVGNLAPQVAGDKSALDKPEMPRQNWKSQAKENPAFAGHFQRKEKGQKTQMPEIGKHKTGIGVEKSMGLEMAA